MIQDDQTSDDDLQKNDGAQKNGTLESELEIVKQELEQMTEMAKRTMADMQNLRRRSEDERKNYIIMSNMALIKQALPVLDNLDRAKEHVPENSSEWFKGIEMSINQLHKIFQEAGLKSFDSLGQPFNPDLHEAIAEGPGEKGIIIEEFEKGYMLGDRIIRHAKVKVGNGE